MNSFIRWLFGEKIDQSFETGKWALGFSSNFNGYVTLALMVVLGLLVYLTIRSYRREGDAPRKTKYLLAGIRIAVIVLTLMLLFKPALVLRITRVLTSDVVVLFDDTSSMRHIDSYESDPNARVDLCKTLNITDAQLSAMRRVDIAKAVLTREKGPLARLAQDHNIILRRLGTTQPASTQPDSLRQAGSYTASMGMVAQTKPPGENPAVGTTAPAPVYQQLQALTDQLVAAGPYTNYPKALSETIEAISGRRITGLVVVGDFQQTVEGDREDRLPMVKALALARRVPLWAVLVGDPTPPRIVSITGLGGPRDARRNTPMEFRVELTHRNAGGESAVVHLKVRKTVDDKGAPLPADTPWQEVAVQTIALTGPKAGETSNSTSTGVQTVIIKDIKQAEAGEYTYRAELETKAKPQEGQSVTAETLVSVADSKINVLLISSDSNWEFQYLRTLLMRQSDQYQLSTWQQNTEKDVSQVASSDEMRLPRLPKNMAELMGNPEEGSKMPKVKYNLVILFDPQYKEDTGFNSDFIKLLDTFVTEKGGGVCYIAGGKFTSDMLAAKAATEKLQDLLPVVLAPNPPIIPDFGKQPVAYPMLPTAYGREDQILKMDGAGENVEGFFQTLPGIYWSYPVLKAKPAARVLAESSNPNRRTSKNEAEPLIVTAPVGAGRTMYIGTPELWRWRLLHNGHTHESFWHNAIRYLGATVRKRIEITAGGDRFATGQDVVVNVEASDESYMPVKKDSFLVTVAPVDEANKGKAPQMLKLLPVEDRPGRYRATFVPTEIGTFELTALEGDPRQKEWVSSKRIRVELPQAEMARIEADEAWMRSMAPEGSEGKNCMRITQADKLADLLPPDRTLDMLERRHELWDTNLMLMAIVGLLTLEWILRKKHNMA